MGNNREINYKFAIIDSIALHAEYTHLSVSVNLILKSCDGTKSPTAATTSLILDICHLV